MSAGEFLWGVSTSGYQSEGGYNGEGEPKNNWARAERAGTVMTTGRTSEFWTRYQEDFALCRGMGCDAFRLGIEWARVQPSESSEELAEAPAFDRAAIAAYADRMAAARKAGLEPVVTLQHFTHPAWLGPDAWLEDRVVGLFAEYVREVVQGVNARLVGEHGVEPMRWVITLNEPNMLIQNTFLAPQFPGRRRGLKAGIEAMNRMLAAHVRAYNVVHDLYEAEGWGEVRVTTNTFCSDVYWSEQVIYDLLSLREGEGAVRGDGRLEAVFARGVADLRTAVAEARLPFAGGFTVWMGRALTRFIDWLSPRYFTTESFAFFRRELAESKRERVFDFIGLDYYDPFSGHMFRPPTFADLEFKARGFHAWLMDGMTSKWWDWRMLPEGLHFFAGYYTKRYGRPLLIAENGMAHRRRADNRDPGRRRDEMTRSEFLRRHLAEVARLRREGCPVVGYFHWSLTDNYEWGSFTPRFGLFTLDYAHGADRLVEDHLGDRPSETYAKLIADARREFETADLSRA